MDRWQAVVARDARADGAFVYGVRSTGIYCRPSCPSRKPRRDRAAFFSSCDEAEHAGFRPCRRCRPRAASETSLIARAVTAWTRLAGQREDGRVPLQALASAVGASPSHLQRTFRHVLGVSPRELAEGRRLDALRRALKEKRSVTDAIYEAGFGSPSRVYERSSRALGMTPAQYAQGGAGAIVRYTCVSSAAGRLLVAATTRGVCAVKLGASDAELVRLLREEFPAAVIDSGDPALRGWVEGILAMIDGKAPKAQVPLDITGTAFQLRVWKELQKIPVGETRSYAEVARRIGKPRAFRAVARACATNPVCVAVPCHRVVASDGTLGGYHWGVERKEALLERERR
ncbi:MAG TPA: bifunctional DNA-binding transcriptional regulator/O6-methylguanine-DNA methyltransferase Ada [Vicinamibacterales bacterium]|nr:bifunctional DNA-binding transcriptional regulator/O6-methylguanine-DNA methyltransferase Ada [Vicinamibacterales bacterium]